MEETRSSMRSSNSYPGEMMIKVPAPFAGLSELGFTVQYRAQGFNEPQRDVPLLFDGAPIGDYVMNLVRPVVFTFLRDCAEVAHLRLSDVIEMRLSAERKSIAEFALPVRDIVQPNGERLL